MRQEGAPTVCQVADAEILSLGPASAPKSSWDIVLP